jgi:hypothetical protein
MSNPFSCVIAPTIPQTTVVAGHPRSRRQLRGRLTCGAGIPEYTTSIWLAGIPERTITALTACAMAQDGTITADPNAVEMRKIWEVAGNTAGGDYVGFGVGGLGDIFGTGHGVWAVFYGKLNEWRFYVADSTGALPTTPFQRIANLGGGKDIILGDFWGTGHKAFVFHTGSADTTGPRTKYYFGHSVFRTDSARLDTVESAILNTRTMNPPVETIGPDYSQVADLDGDGADELIVPIPGLWRGGELYTGVEIWIFKGGPHFQLDTPTVIIKGTDLPGGQKEYAVEDIDGDHHPDILVLDATGEIKTHYLRILWGDGTLGGYNDSTHHRIVRVSDGDLSMTTLDCDGDHIADIVLNRWIPSSERGPFIFRSLTGKNARLRSYQTDDADLHININSGSIRAGYVNDTAKRYELLLLGYGDRNVLLNGGPNGPDLKYDAWSKDNAFRPLPIPDVDGDGWDDYIGGNSSVWFNGGVAQIFAGGPYIPRDKSLGVDDIAVAGVRDAVSIWPNPAHDEVHIAWRGDLKRMPRRFVVHDMLGREITSGDVAAGTAAALWHCDGVAIGIYLVSIYDASQTLLTTARIIKQ